MSSSNQEDRQRLKQAKVEFETLLRKLLPECARGRSGLFGQHAKAVGKEVAAKYYAWPEADKLLALSEEIQTLQEKVGDTSSFALLDAYLGYRAETGAMPSEPRLALRFLQELKREEFESQGRPMNIERYAETIDEDEDEMSVEE